MTQRGSTSPTDRLFACAAYLLPTLDLMGLVAPYVAKDPLLGPILGRLFMSLLPLLQLYYGFPFLPLILFFALYLLVVRNASLAHFIRFNVMQSILFGIILSLISIVWGYILSGLIGSLPFIQSTLFNTIFLGTLVAVGYSIVQSALGKYAEIPTISDAAYNQVRY